MNWDRTRDDLNRLAPALDLRKNGHFERITGEVGGGLIHKRIQNVLARPLDDGNGDEVLEDD